jgi:flagellar operon protein
VTAPVNGMGGLSPLPPPTRATPPATPPAPAGGCPTGGLAGPSFAEQLSRSSGEVRLSKHALERVQRRGIATGEPTMARLRHGVDLAAGKGARDAVVMVDDTAFVVSVRNRTVITAVDSAHMRDQVFTNIDSAVIA